MGLQIGVDGCKFGWFAVFSIDEQLRYALYRTMPELLASHPEAEQILVDIPIGLPSKTMPDRHCEALARKVLGPRRASSVFSVPSRRAVYAGDVDEARRRNLEEVGKSLSAQSWGICKKIAEVDELLRSHTGAPNRMHEIHPEVCFWALNGRRPMQSAKSTPNGLSERLEVLARVEPQAERVLRRALSEQLRKHVKADDVLDAMAAYVTARSSPAAICRLQGTPSHDEFGLPMEMLYVG